MSEAIKNQKIASQEPFIFDNNWGTWGRLPQDANQLTTTNADGKPVVPLTEEQKFIFDTKSLTFWCKNFGTEKSTFCVKKADFWY